MPPLVGHINPTIAVGREFKNANHEIAWVGHSSIVSHLLPNDFKLIAADESKLVSVYKNWISQSKSIFGLESFKFFFQDFMLPLAHAMVPSVEYAIHQFKPDVLICDQQALAGFVAAQKHHLPWVTFATTPAGVFNPMEQFPKIKFWMMNQLAEFQKYYGFEPRERPDLSENLVIIFSIRELVDNHINCPQHFHFVGPSIRTETNCVHFPWHELRQDCKKVYLTLGTLNAERSLKFYEKVSHAFANKDIQLIVSAPPEIFSSIPKNFIVQKDIPQIELLKHIDAVIFHGGHNTFCESLFNGLPFVVAPIKDDQPVVAEQIVKNNLGVRVHFDRVKSVELLASTQKILHESKFSTAAQKIQKILEGKNGAREAVRLTTDTIFT